MSKSRSGKTPSNNQNAPPGPAQNAIIPGKFMESDWYELLEIEEDENFIADIIDEITDAALDQVASNIVKSRVLPHTVLSARELLLEVIEWQFLQSDPGEVGTGEKLSWIEDDEPLTSIIDTWAQGAVPVEICAATGSASTSISPLPSVIEENNASSLRSGLSSAAMSTDPELVEMDVSNESMDESFPNDEQDINAEDSVLAVTVQLKESLNLCDKSNDSLEKKLPSKPPHGSPSSQSKVKSKKYRPHVGQLPNFEKISLESVTDLRPKPGTRVVEGRNRGLGIPDMDPSSELLVRNQYGRASGPKEVIYDESGKVVRVEKLNVANFPNHRVPVKYSVIDNETTQPTTNNTTRRNHKKNPDGGVKRSTYQRNHNLEKNSINASTLLRRIHPPLNSWTSVTSSGLNFANNMSSVEPRSPLPPLMVDSMNVSDGVTIREGGLSKQVIKKSTLENIMNNNSNNRAMLPISDQSTRVLNVKEIVGDTAPRYISNTA